MSSNDNSWSGSQGGPEQIPPTLPNGQAVPFDWEKRWLKGHEYSYILQNMEAYCLAFGFHRYEQKTHPKEIYSEPVNGLIYFVKGKGVGQDFGFPRMQQVKKKYRWKKMNFTTDLPKRHPHVTYVVASAMRAHLVDQNENAEFRMHAVISYCNGKNSSENNEYILCHVRSVDQKKDLQETSLRSCYIDAQIDFYRLFACLHNLTNEAHH